MEGKPPINLGKKVQVDSFLLKSIDDNSGMNLSLERHAMSSDK